MCRIERIFLGIISISVLSIAQSNQGSLESNKELKTTNDSNSISKDSKQSGQIVERHPIVANADAGLKKNKPCEDSLYLLLSHETFSDMTLSEWFYYKRMKKECNNSRFQPTEALALTNDGIIHNLGIFHETWGAIGLIGTGISTIIILSNGTSKRTSWTSATTWGLLATAVGYVYFGWEFGIGKNLQRYKSQ